MSLNAGASQRAQGHSPGLGGRGTHRRGVAPGAVASLPAGRRRPEAGRSHRTATRMEIRWELRLGDILWHVGQAGLGPEESSGGCLRCTVAALLTAVPPGSASSTFALSSSTQGASAACHVGLNHESTAVHGVCKGLWHADAALDLRLRCASRRAPRISYTL